MENSGQVVRGAVITHEGHLMDMSFVTRFRLHWLVDCFAKHAAFEALTLLLGCDGVCPEVSSILVACSDNKAGWCYDEGGRRQLCVCRLNVAVCGSYVFSYCSRCDV